jgi:hypothetical protein
VDAWLAGSAVTRVTCHRTDVLSSASIHSSGVRLGWSRGGAFGVGFYTSTEVDEFYGDATVVVAVRLMRPLIGAPDEVEERIDRLHRTVRPADRGLTPEGAAAVRAELLRLGYDGLIVHDAGGDGVAFVIALHPETVRVVVP